MILDAQRVVAAGGSTMFHIKKYGTAPRFSWKVIWFASVYL